MKLKPKTARKRVLQILDSNKPAVKKYELVKKLILDYQPIAKKDLIRRAVPILKQIYHDNGARQLFQRDFIVTIEFLRFLEMVTNES